MTDILACASALTALLITCVAVRFCRRRTSVMERGAFAASLLLSVAAAMAIVAWERSPRCDSAEIVSPALDARAVEREASWYRAEHVAALIGAAVLIAVGLMTLSPAVRNVRLFPVFYAAWGCLAVLMLGYVAGIVARKQDEVVTRARGDRIVSALERYRAANGRYPAELGSLAPAYLPEIPHPRVGWGEQSFAYFPHGTRRYDLVYLSARDVMTWREPSRYPGWVPRYMLWE